MQVTYTSKWRRSYEQLLRRLMLLPSKPAVLLLQAYPWWMSFGDGLWQGLYYRKTETEMTVLAQVNVTLIGGCLAVVATSTIQGCRGACACSRAEGQLAAKPGCSNSKCPVDHIQLHVPSCSRSTTTCLSCRYGRLPGG